MDIQQRDLVLTTAGEVGEVEKVNVVNGVPFYRIRYLVKAWGCIYRTGSTELINIGDVVAVKHAAPIAEATSAA